MRSRKLFERRSFVRVSEARALEVYERRDRMGCGTVMPGLHLITCEYPPLMGGVSEHSRVLAETAAAAGYDVQVWTGGQGATSNGISIRPDLGDFSATALDKRRRRTRRVRRPATTHRSVGAAWLRPEGVERRVQRGGCAAAPVPAT